MILNTDPCRYYRLHHHKPLHVRKMWQRIVRHNQEIATGDGANPVTLLALAAPIDPNSITISDAEGDVQDDGEGNLVGAAGVGTINYQLGTGSVIWDTTPTLGEPINARWKQITFRIAGGYSSSRRGEKHKASNNCHTLAFDKKRRFNATYRLLRTFARYWRQGHGPAFRPDGNAPGGCDGGFLGDTSINKAAWNSWAASHDYPTRYGGFTHKNGYQWFIGINTANNIAMEAGPISPTQTVLMYSPNPPFAWAMPTLASLRFLQLPGSFMAFQPAPFYIHGTTEDPATSLTIGTTAVCLLSNPLKATAGPHGKACGNQRDHYQLPLNVVAVRQNPTTIAGQTGWWYVAPLNLLAWQWKCKAPCWAVPALYYVDNSYGSNCPIPIDNTQAISNLIIGDPLPIDPTLF